MAAGSWARVEVAAAVDELGVADAARRATMR